jgi:hypothetical protein
MDIDTEMVGPVPTTVTDVLNPSLLATVEAEAQHRKTEMSGTRAAEVARVTARMRMLVELKEQARVAVERLLAEWAAEKTTVETVVAALGRGKGHEAAILGALLDHAQQLRGMGLDPGPVVDRTASSELDQKIYFSLPYHLRSLYSSAGLEGRQLTGEQLSKLLP